MLSAASSIVYLFTLTLRVPINTCEFILHSISISSLCSPAINNTYKLYNTLLLLWIDILHYCCYGMTFDTTVAMEWHLTLLLLWDDVWHNCFYGMTFDTTVGVGWHLTLLSLWDDIWHYCRCGMTFDTTVAKGWAVYNFTSAAHITNFMRHVCLSRRPTGRSNVARL